MANANIPPPDTTIRPPTRPSSNGAVEKVEGGGDRRGMLVKNTWNTQTVRMMYVACTPPHLEIEFPEGNKEEGTSRENGRGYGRCTFWRGWRARWEIQKSEHRWRPGDGGQGRHLPPCMRWYTQCIVGITAEFGAGRRCNQKK